MSRPFVRRLAAVALLAALCLALPAAAAAPRHTGKAPATAPSLWNEILAWIGDLLGGSSPVGVGSRDKAMTSQPVSPTNGTSSASTEISIGVDPNGHS
jgi:hypothetical protein